MSDSFDPHKVKRVVAEADFGEGWYDYDIVQSEDYDRLLALYDALRGVPHEDAQ